MYGTIDKPCEKCVEQGKLEEGPRWKLFFKLSWQVTKLLWKRKVLRQKPKSSPFDTSGSKGTFLEFKYPRFYCATCKQYVPNKLPDTIQLARTELADEFVIRCHGETTVQKLTFVALMMKPCHWTVFPPEQKRPKLPDWIADLAKQLDEAEKKEKTK